MEPDKKDGAAAAGGNTPDNGDGGAKPPSAEQTAPSDALEKTNEELEAEAANSGPPADGEGTPPPKKGGPLRQFFRRFNVYFLLFLLVLVIAGVVATVAYLNSRKTPKTPQIATQTLTPDTLKQLANSDATVGDTGQTLTVQGNAVFTGQVLVRSNLNVAGTIQLGGAFSVPELTVSNTANLGSTQISALQVAQGSTFQGGVTLQSSLNVAGAASFNGPVTAGQISVTRLIMTGNGQLQVPGHLAFPGASPDRSAGPALGSGGSTSVSGSDTAGTVNVNTGSGTSPGCFITITFNQRFTSTPHVLVTPVGAAAGQTQFYVTRSTTQFSICTANAAPTGQQFGFDYFVAG